MSVNPVLIDVPESYETPRLVLRAPRAGDGTLVHEAIAESFAELHEVMYWARSPASRKECEVDLRLARAKFLAREDMRLLIFHREEGRLLGSTGLHAPDWTVPRFEIGYWLRTGATGNGFATEAVSAVARLGFERLGARRIEIRCDARNERSVAVAHRLGFELEGRLRRHRRAPDGEVSDTLVFARLGVEGLPETGPTAAD